MSTIIGNYIYGDPTTSSNVNITPYTWVGPTSTGTIVIGNVSIVTEPVPGTTYYNRTLKVSVSFPEAVKVKAGLSDSVFASMPFTVSNTAQQSHEVTVTLPAGTEGAQTLYFKTAYANDSNAPYMPNISFNVEPAPIGPDTNKLLRLRKFSHNGAISRWNGKQFE